MEIALLKSKRGLNGWDPTWEASPPSTLVHSFCWIILWQTVTIRHLAV